MCMTTGKGLQMLLSTENIFADWPYAIVSALHQVRLLPLRVSTAYISSSSRLSFNFTNELDQVIAPSSTRATSNQASTQANVAGVVASLFAAPLAYYWRRKLRKYELFVSDYFVDVPVHLLNQLERFSLSELKVATESFSNRNIIDRGGFFTVYKGRLADGSLVAINKQKEEHAGNGDRQFRTEVKMKFSMGEHPNLLQLRGFCLTQIERILVYPFIADGTVASWLGERTESQRPLDWPIREQIALGSAKALAYLHEQCHQKIIHCDVKAANILLNEAFEAVVGDFGLAEFTGHKNAHLSTDIEAVIYDFGLFKHMEHKDTHVNLRGTFGQIAPEYLSASALSEKTDVFGYGIMLLELITGLRAFDLARLANDEALGLLDWVKGLSGEHKLEAFVDADLRGNYTDDKLKQLVQVSILCSQRSPDERPSMSDVVRMLQGDGLAERWQYWQEQELHPQQSNYARHHSDIEWSIVNYMYSVGADELSGPR